MTQKPRISIPAKAHAVAYSACLAVINANDELEKGHIISAHHLLKEAREHLSLLVNGKVTK